MVFWACPLVCAGEPAALFERFLSRMRDNLKRLPDYACTQDIERFSRLSGDRPWTKLDMLRLEVALVGDRELYAPPGARRFQERPLEDAVTHGMTSTGQFGLLARHVFLASAARFTYRRPVDLGGRSAHEYEYDVPPERSQYRLRAKKSEAVVGFQGAFSFDAATLNLIRLEVQAYDIPPSVDVAEATIEITYSPMDIGGGEFLLPVSATLSMTAPDGTEHLNRMRLTGCSRFTAESRIAFEVPPVPEERTAGNPEPEPVESPVPAAGITLPAGALLHLTLESSLDPATAKVGDPVVARVARPVKDGDAELIPEGARVTGRLVRLERELTPFPLFEIGLEFHTVESGGRELPFRATMEDAGPASGLIREARRLNPTFSKRRAPRLDILVREVQRGQGILHWDARRKAIGRGLAMKWRIEGAVLPTED